METEVLAKRVRPFFSRITLVESPVTEDERDSGLVLPHTFDGDDGVKRGVVQHVDTAWDSNDQAEELDRQIPPGTVVFYRGGVSIRDVVILERDQILAFEVDE